MTSGLKLTVYRPTGQLASYVRQFQVLSAEKGTDASLLDFGGADVSVPLRFGDHILVEELAPTRVESATVVGPRTRSVWLRFAGHIDQLNISFFPGAAGAFVGVSMPELVGRMAPPDDVWPLDFRQAVSELEPLSIEERISRLGALLLARLDSRREPGAQVREAVRLVTARRGHVHVRWLAIAPRCVTQPPPCRRLWRHGAAGSTATGHLSWIQVFLFSNEPVSAR